MNAALLVFTWLSPLVLALLAYSRKGRLLPALATLPALAAAALVPSNESVEIPWLLLGVQLGLDDTSRIFLLFTAVLWLVAGAQATLQMSDDSRAGRFRVVFMLAMGGNFGLIIGQDLSSFYLGFALMGLAAYGLVVHDGTESVRHAGRVYLVMTLAAEFALLIGLLLLYQRTGDLTPDVGAIIGAGNIELTFLGLAFAIKAGLIGVHFWLPLAHPAAPVPASAVLSGTMIKAALIGWMRYLPLGESALPEFGGLLLAVGAMTTLSAIPVGLMQKEPKAVLAYSSIGKMGIMSAAIGLIAMDPRLAPAVISALAIYAAHHGLAKGALFLGVGIAKDTGASWVFYLLFIPALALAGAPLTSGAAAKDILKIALDTGHSGWIQMFVGLLFVSTFGATLLMARFLNLVRPYTTDPSSHGAGLALPWLGLLVLVLAFPLVVNGGPPSAMNTAIVIAGIAIAAVIWFYSPTRGVTWVGRVPPGDIFEWILRYIRGAGLQLTAPLTK